MNRRGMELAVSTMILLVIGVLVLIGFVYILTGEFAMFKGTSQSFIDTATASAVKQGCSLACTNSDKLTYCCKNYTVDGQKVACGDKRLEVSCELDCKEFGCR
jgi:hypothetical protein